MDGIETNFSLTESIQPYLAAVEDAVGGPFREEDKDATVFDPHHILALLRTRKHVYEAMYKRARLDGDSTSETASREMEWDGDHEEGNLSWDARVTSPLEDEAAGSKRALAHKVPSVQQEQKPAAGKKRPRERGGWALALANKDAFKAKLLRLLDRTLKQSDVFRNLLFSTVTDSSASSSGWHGKSMGKKQLASMKRRWKNGQLLKEVLETFQPIFYREKPVMILDKAGRCFAFRTATVPFLAQNATQFCEAMDILLSEHLSSSKIRKKCQAHIRGPHFPCIMGWYRPFADHPVRAEFHASNKDKVAAFMTTDVIEKTTQYVSKLVEVLFPGVAARLRESAAWHNDAYPGVKPEFGLFWNLCVNGIFPGTKHYRIHCGPHIDWKNVVGVCVLVVYQLPGYTFDHRRKSWLVLWEAKVAIQLPPWVVLVYPSSLLHHFNVDIDDFKFVTTNGEYPTPENSTPIGADGDKGRGTLVYFNQGALYQSSETGYPSLIAAEEAGVVTTTDLQDGIESAMVDFSDLFL